MRHQLPTAYRTVLRALPARGRVRISSLPAKARDPMTLAAMVAESPPLIELAYRDGSERIVVNHAHHDVVSELSAEDYRPGLELWTSITTAGRRELSRSAISSADNPVDRIGIRAEEAARMLGISSRTLWTLTNRDEIPCKKIGGATVYSIDELRRWTADPSPVAGRDPE